MNRVWRRRLAVALAVALAAAGGLVVAHYLDSHPSPTERVFDRPEQATGPVELDLVWRAGAPSDGEKLFALTFDDGPDPQWTPQVLDILAAHGAHATFFMLGEAAQANPDLVAQVVAGGHQIGLHGWDHSRLTTMSQDQIGDALDRAAAAIAAAGGGQPGLLRPTYGRIDAPGLGAVAERGYRVVLWSHALHGDEAAAGEVDQIVAGASPGMIVLCHDGRTEPTAELMVRIDELLSQLEADGYRAVTVGELLAAATPD
ncbi:MAG: polysaccharide deacetylase family protein [Bifidobacteriaceae bacterium]|nr:polysaccharide deacetylase family protein [Bifidobacteriaceae bacterium]